VSRDLKWQQCYIQYKIHISSFVLILHELWFPITVIGCLILVVAVALAIATSAKIWQTVRSHIKVPETKLTHFDKRSQPGCSRS